MTPRTLTDAELELVAYAHCDPEQAQHLVNLFRLQICVSADQPPVPAVDYQRKISTLLCAADYSAIN